MKIDLSTIKEHIKTAATLIREDSPQPLEERHLTEARQELEYALVNLKLLEKNFNNHTVKP